MSGPQLTTGKETALLIGVGDDPQDPSASPDGRLLLRNLGRGVDIFSLHNRSDGFDYDEEWTSPYLRAAYWMADSHHWVELISSPHTDKLTRAVVHSLTPPRHKKSIPIPPTNFLNRLPPLTMSYRSASDIDREDTHILSEDRVLAHTLVRSLRKGLASVDVFVGSLRADARHTQHFIIHAPSGSKIYDAVFSPDGTRIAWLLKEVDANRVRLAVSRLDGSRMQELGYLDIHPLSEEKQAPLWWLYSLQWVTGGKQLSFLYQDVLYTVPAGNP